MQAHHRRMRILIIGAGDVAARALPALLKQGKVFALVRREEERARWRALGAIPLLGDLDQPATLRRLAGLADKVVHCAPPQNHGVHDLRTRHLIAALSRTGRPPRRLVYISTTGVYGDYAGALVSETSPLRTGSDRARRRVDAEQVLRAWALQSGVSVAIVRAPGIYAEDRLPIARLHAGEPVLTPEDDVFTNHIHADDLATITVAALNYGQAGRCYNAVDQSALKMGEYFDWLAEQLALPKPPKLSWEALRQQISPLRLSFMAESRQMQPTRLDELRVSLRYPTVQACLHNNNARFMEIRENRGLPLC